MTHEELAARHKELHRALDELLACFIESYLELAHSFGSVANESILDQPIRKLLEFSYRQTVEQSCHQRHQNGAGK